jgi:hypothetical protein
MRVKHNRVNKKAPHKRLVYKTLNKSLAAVPKTRVFAANYILNSCLDNRHCGDRAVHKTIQPPAEVCDLTNDKRIALITITFFPAFLILR